MTPFGVIFGDLQVQKDETEIPDCYVAQNLVVRSLVINPEIYHSSCLARIVSKTKSKVRGSGYIIFLAKV